MSCLWGCCHCIFTQTRRDYYTTREESSPTFFPHDHFPISFIFFFRSCPSLLLITLITTLLFRHVSYNMCLPYSHNTTIDSYATSISLLKIPLVVTSMFTHCSYLMFKTPRSTVRYLTLGTALLLY